MRTFILSKPVPSSLVLWEEAYRRFESNDEEIEKFIKRLGTLGAARWPRTARVAELFCGRGNGLHALERLGFKDFEGIDLSPSLAVLYEGSGKITVGDCRILPWSDGSKDILIVQGGLHHLNDFQGDLDRVLSEACRTLVRNGKLIVVEPWLTPFLQFLHFCSFSPLRWAFQKLDAFATMVEHERDTYEPWLQSQELIRVLLSKHFYVEHCSFKFGKMYFVGIKR